MRSQKEKIFIVNNLFHQLSDLRGTVEVFNICLPTCFIKFVKNFRSSHLFNSWAMARATRRKKTIQLAKRVTGKKPDTLITDGLGDLSQGISKRVLDTADTTNRAYQAH